MIAERVVNIPHAPFLQFVGARPQHAGVVAARPINEPVARYGPFVMNTEAEIRQAFHDYQSGRLVSDPN